MLPFSFQRSGQRANILPWGDGFWEKTGKPASAPTTAASPAATIITVTRMGPGPSPSHTLRALQLWLLLAGMCTPGRQADCLAYTLPIIARCACGLNPHTHTQRISSVHTPAPLSHQISFVRHKVKEKNQEFQDSNRRALSQV